MKINFNYSIKKEISEAINMVLYFKDYQNLRSIVCPYPTNIIRFASKKDNSIKEVEKVWIKVHPKVEEIFKKYQLRELENVTCYLHGISCEG